MYKYLLAIVLLMQPVSSRPASALPSLPDLSNFQTLCYDAQAVGQIIQLYQGAVVAGSASPTTSGLQAAANFMANMLPNICNIVIAVDNALDTEGVLGAARVANDLGIISLDAELAFVDDSTSLHQFLQRIAPITENTKEKLLNVNNHRRVLNYAKNWVLPVVKKSTGVDADARSALRDINRARDRAAKANILQDQLRGCRTNATSSVLSNNQVEVNGRKYSYPKFKKDSEDQADHARVKDASLEKARTLRDVLLDMLSEAVNTPQEFVSAQTLIDRLFDRAYWVSVGYEAPQSKNLTAPRQIERVTAGGKVEKTIDPSSQQYTNQGTSNPRACDDIDNFRWHTWILSNPDAINDNYIDPSNIARSVKVCPAQDPKNQRLDSVVEVTSDQWLADREKEYRQREEALCRTRTAESTLKALKNLKSFNTDRSRDSLIIRDDKCKEVKNENILPPENFFQTAEEIETLDDFIDHYNTIFYDKVIASVGVGMKENAVSNSFRSLNRTFNDLGDGGKFDSRRGTTFSSEQRGITSRWRRLSRCNNPRYLEKNFPNEYEAVYGETSIQNNSEHERAYLLSVAMDRCRRDEIDPKNNDRIFRDMFESYLDELNDYKTAEAATVTYELQYGFYKSADAAQKGCEDPLKPADIAKITADLSALNVQLAIEEAQARRETEQRAIAEKREKQAEELKKENEIMEIRKSHKRITQKQNLADQEIQSAETKRAYDSMFPTNITEKGRLEADRKN